MTENAKEVTIYTDGGAEPNPGPGGYGAILVHGNRRRELSGGFRKTTNNRMEITAAIKGLQALKTSCKVKLYSDSKYLVDSMSSGSVANWQRNGWQRGKTPVPNADLWTTLLTLCQTNEVHFEWVKGHAGHPENERCDVLSMQFLQMKDLETDEGYETAAHANTPALLPLTFAAQSPTRSAKITAEGQPCRKCQTPVVKRIPRRRIRPRQTYSYEYFLFCPACKTMYMVEAAKRTVTQ